MYDLIKLFQLYDATGNELCITAVNVNMVDLEYFHPKTTPDVPINLALRMSVSIPGEVFFCMHHLFPSFFH